MQRALLCLTVLFFMVAFSPRSIAAAAAGGSYAAWQRHHETRLKDASLVRCYTFETATPGAPVPNLAGEKAAALNFRFQQKAGAPVEPLRVVAGRWPQMKAVRLDQVYLATEPFPVTNKSFTAAAWAKLNGPGAHRGNNESANGTLLSVGSGYWDGWRLTVSYPLRTLGFEIGRPKPSHSVGIRATGVLNDAVWHHLVASWDGREMRLYVDGALASSGAYDGNYTPPAADGQFRIGYAGHGLGSVVFDVDEVTIYSRALSAEEILRAVEFCGPQAPGVRRNLAQLCRQRKDFSGAREHYRALLESPALGLRDRLNALFELGRLCWQTVSYTHLTLPTS
ncbi:MAG: LamG domain-containing protein, partial [Verrucomicrobiae bacterium]|nr:LamG domain-containing protein [Verrucomicrobiae bacterium]